MLRQNQEIKVKCGGTQIKLKQGEEKMIVNKMITNSPIKITQLTKQNISITKNGYFDSMTVQGSNLNSAKQA